MENLMTLGIRYINSSLKKDKGGRYSLRLLGARCHINLKREEETKAEVDNDSRGVQRSRSHSERRSL
jgi:hypothetical protein